MLGKKSGCPVAIKDSNVRLRHSSDDDDGDENDNLNH